jgi:hypothetical protein
MPSFQYIAAAMTCADRGDGRTPEGVAPDAVSSSASARLVAQEEVWEMYVSGGLWCSVPTVVSQGTHMIVYREHLLPY